MYVRLAFAVAAHLEPEILLVDEVLAVGDAAFQKKCLGKMSEVAGGGRTVLFVSHNMTAVKRLCTRTIYLREGQINFNGDTHTAIDMYLGAFAQQLHVEFPPRPDQPIRIHQLEILNKDGQPAEGDIETSEGFCIRVMYDVNLPVRGVHAFLRIHLQEGETLLSTGDADTAPERFGERFPGRYVADIVIPPRLLGEGNYTITWSAGIPFLTNYDVELHAVSFRVVDFQTSRGEFIHNRRPGYLALDLDWNYLKTDN
jgi:lipopolysaccharide transport system ATP-binding protein